MKAATMNPLAMATIAPRLAVQTILLFITLLPTPLIANDKAPVAQSFRDRVCDQAILADGTRLTGIIIGDSPARIVVRSKRLQDESPELFQENIQPALVLQQQDDQLISILQAQLQQIQQTQPQDRQQIGLLEETIERLTSHERAAPPWIILEIDANRLKRLVKLAENRRDLARYACLNEIPDFEDLHWKVVQAKLQAIPPAQLKHPTAKREAVLPDVIAERILAAIDVRLNHASRLIRTGDAFVKEDAKPDLTVVFNSLMGSSLNTTLQELLDETGGAGAGQSAAMVHQSTNLLPAAAIRLAEQDGHTTVVVSSFEFSIERQEASVTKQLFRKSMSGKWNSIMASTLSASINDTTTDQVKQIEEDPQITQLKGLISQLGTNDSAFTSALQMGAVVQSALSRADVAFQKSLQDALTSPSGDHEYPPTILLQAPAN